jgi:hypothetical protein
LRERLSVFLLSVKVVEIDVMGVDVKGTGGEVNDKSGKTGDALAAA